MMRSTPSPTLVKRIAGLVSALFFASLLAACGGDSDSPTPTVVPVAPTSSAPAGGSPSTAVTVGDLADLMAAAWSGVDTIRQRRSTVTESSGPSATPAGQPDSAYMTEVDASGSKRVVIEVGGAIVGEIVAIGGDIWARGFMPIPLEATGPPFGEGWVAVTPEAVQSDPTATQLVNSMLSPYPPLYSGLSTTERERVVEPLGQRDVAGRACEAFRIPATTATGEAYDVILTIDDRGLPCAVETIALGQTTIDLFTFNDPFTIVRPEGPPMASPTA
jgi:hypothetical protein